MLADVLECMVSTIRPLDSKTYLDFLSIATWAQNPCREWNQSVSSLSRAVEGKHIVTLHKELDIWDKTLKDNEETKTHLKNEVKNWTEAAVRNKGESEKLKRTKIKSSYHVCQCWDDFTQCCQRLVNIGSLLKNTMLLNFLLILNRFNTTKSKYYNLLNRMSITFQCNSSSLMSSSKKHDKLLWLMSKLSHDSSENFPSTHIYTDYWLK